MAKRILTPEEEFDLAHRAYEAERLKRAMGGEIPPLPVTPEWQKSTSALFGDWLTSRPGAIYDTLKEGAKYWTSSPYRALEFPAELLSHVAVPATRGGEVIDELIGTPEGTGYQTLGEAGRKIGGKLHEKAVKYGTKAGGYEPSTALALAGSLKWPWPGPKPVGTAEKFIPTLKEATPLIRETAKGGAAGTGYGVLADPENAGEWGAFGAAGQPIVGRLAAGRLAASTVRKPPESASGTVIPEIWPTEPPPKPPAPQHREVPLQAPSERPLEPEPTLFERPEAPAEPPTASTEDLVREVLQESHTPELPPMPAGEGFPAAEQPIAPHRVYGQSLLNFIRSKGGIAGDRGDVRGMEIPNLLNNKRGLPLDTIAELAQEAGYIPERNINQLLEAIDREARGKAVYAPGKENARLLEQQMEQDYARYLRDRPAEPMSPEEPAMTTAELVQQIIAKLDEEPVRGLSMRDRLPDDVVDVQEITRGAPTVEEIHSLAQSKGIRTDNDPVFMDLTERLTGKRHLDDLTADERVRVLNEIEATSPQPMPGELFPGSETMEVGAAPIIGREATLEEAPLFSRQAQTPEPEQVPLAQAPDERVTKFMELANLQRGEPESAMLRVQKAMSGGVLSHTAEHVGDLTNRMTNLAKWGGSGWENVREKLDKTIKTLDHPYGFAREHAENIKNNAEYFNVPVEQFEARVDAALKEYADAHRALPVYNEVQRLARDAAVAVGEKRWEDASDLLHTLSDKAKTPEQFAREAEKFETSVAPKAGLPDESPMSEAGQVQREVSHETNENRSLLERITEDLNDEGGGIHIGTMGPLEKTVLTPRRIAERHPEFKPVYELASQRSEFSHAMSSDLHEIGADYFRLPEADRKILDAFLRTRRRMGTEGPQGTMFPKEMGELPERLKPAKQAMDRMMDSAWQLINDVRGTKGMAPIERDEYYVPFSRSGDYLVVAKGQNVPKWVTAAKTFREAKQIAKDLQAKHPTAQVDVKSASHRKGDLPALDFGTLHQLEKAGFLSPEDLARAIEEFDLPPGFSEHFRKAELVLGEATDLLDPIERYLHGISAYAGRFLYDERMNEAASKILDPELRPYSDRYIKYLNEKPREFGRIRGAVATWDLMLNFGSIMQNASQVPLLGVPMLESLGHSKIDAVKFIETGFQRNLSKDKPVTIGDFTYTPADVLERAQREGHIRPVNAEELFGTIGVEPLGVELGDPTLYKTLPSQAYNAIEQPLYAVTGALEKGYDRLSHANRALGQKLSYAFSRLTGKTTEIAADKARVAHGAGMQGFAWIEENNRAASILGSFEAGLSKGMDPGLAYTFATQFSRDVNFDYSPVSRAPAFRGIGAPLGLFMTFQTEYMSTLSKLAKQQLKAEGITGKALGPASTALVAFWTLGGIKGLPGMEDLDLYGLGGTLSRNLPDLLWQGPASTITGLDVASKFKLGPRLPIDPLHGELDLSQLAIADPFFKAMKASQWYADSPKDPPSTQRLVERILPPAARNLFEAGRWAGLGPLGELEQGAVGTIRGHTPGPTDEGKKEFFHPSAKDIAGKALTFTPLELSKRYQRGRLEKIEGVKHRAEQTRAVMEAANHLDRNGPNVPNEALRKLSPQTRAALLKAHGKKMAGREKASTYQLFRESQEPKAKQAAGQK